MVQRAQNSQNSQIFPGPAPENSSSPAPKILLPLNQTFKPEHTTAVDLIFLSSFPTKKRSTVVPWYVVQNWGGAAGASLLFARWKGGAAEGEQEREDTRGHPSPSCCAWA